MPKVSLDSMVGVSPSSKGSVDKDGFLLPEFNDVVKEFDFTVANDGFSSNKGDETSRSNMETPKAFRSADKDEYEQEIRYLRNMVRILRERERNLEIQLLEYYGLKEQETAVMELQNRLKINNMEAKLFTLKIESLQADNRRLEAQVGDRAKVVAELEAGRAKIKLLKKKLRSEAEQNKQQILALQQRVAKLQDQEYKVAPGDPNIQLNLQRLRDLEVEAEELRKSNTRLQIENTELSRRLESTQILANSVLEDPEVIIHYQYIFFLLVILSFFLKCILFCISMQAEALRLEREHLRHKNEDLEKDIERLQADRYSDAEELVYLKWINACLRYELRNYQPPDGKAVARDLSKTLSPKSEERAKQLILEYAHTEGMGEKGINIMEVYYEQWSSSQASVLTDSGELDDSSIDNSSATRANSSNKTKLFSNIMKIFRGKDGDDNRVLSAEKAGSLEEGDSPRCSSGISTAMHGGNDGHSNRFSTPQGSSRTSLDLSRFRSPKEEHIKETDGVQTHSDYGSKRSVLGSDGADLAIRKLVGDYDTPEKSELVKYAEVLKDSYGEKPRIRRRSASACSF